MSLIVEDVMSYESRDCKTALPSEKILTYFGLRLFLLRRYFFIWSEWRLTVIAATVRIALVDILDLPEVDIPAGVFLHPAVGWG